MGSLILSIDQGTTSSRAVLFDLSLNVAGIAAQPIDPVFPKKGWVEQDPMEILNSQISVCRTVIEEAGISADRLIGVGITNQRETTILWDKNTGVPIYNAIVWQDTRTADYCRELSDKGLGNMIHSKTGLIIDSYFSATKIKWILENVEGAREKSERGELLFGTVDTWLLWNLTEGKVHATDVTNASRTMLFNIETLEWDSDLLHLFNIPPSILPLIKQNSDDYGSVHAKYFGSQVKVGAMIGDQQSALFGQGCFSHGDVKNTYGTGCFILKNIGNEPVYSDAGLITTPAWQIDNQIVYALEGSVFIAGAVVQWLRDSLGVISNAMETEDLAESIDSNDGVYMVPAFSGLGAPYWDMSAQGIIVGLTRATGKEHFARAALESIAYQTKDVMDVMISDSGMDINSLKVDGGATENAFLMQFQSDILGMEIHRSGVLESTALGVACLCALFLSEITLDDLMKVERESRVFKPGMSPENRKLYLDGWLKAIEKVRLK